MPKEDQDRPDKELRIMHKVFDSFRRLVNVGLATLHVVTAWEPEVLCAVSKVEGSPDIKDTRPIGLVAILRNAVEGMMCDAITGVWEATGILSRLNTGFRRHVGTDSACDHLISTATACRSLSPLEEKCVCVEQGRDSCV